MNERSVLFLTLHGWLQLVLNSGLEPKPGYLAWVCNLSSTDKGCGAGRGLDLLQNHKVLPQWWNWPKRALQGTSARKILPSVNIVMNKASSSLCGGGLLPSWHGLNYLMNIKVRLGLLVDLITVLKLRQKWHSKGRSLKQKVSIKRTANSPRLIILIILPPEQFNERSLCTFTYVFSTHGFYHIGFLRLVGIVGREDVLNYGS